MDKLTDEQKANLTYVWNTLRFFAMESSYTTGERTGGVLQGCPRNPPPSYAEMACYGRQALASLCRYLGREPEEWMTVGICHPPEITPADSGRIKELEALLRDVRRNPANFLTTNGQDRISAALDKKEQSHAD